MNLETQTATIMVDGALGGTAITAPLWLQYVTLYSGAVLAVGGIVLLLLRIFIVWREARGK